MPLDDERKKGHLFRGDNGTGRKDDTVTRRTTRFSIVPNFYLSLVCFQEMTMPPTPLTAIAQTPRKELESKFTFNPVMAKVRISSLIYRLVKG